jgi:hypothetical protein
VITALPVTRAFIVHLRGARPCGATVRCTAVAGTCEGTGERTASRTTGLLSSVGIDVLNEGR